MLSEFDCFIQLKSIYKAGLQLHKLGLVKIEAFVLILISIRQMKLQVILNKYGSTNIQCITDNTIS
ncbi:MAG: hypothetical protein EAZ08_07340 [Cytophagales bacterium]|nr:MAG: hypothetical protein EAZ08_07340 [Cytophagales bacterium]